MSSGPARYDPTDDLRTSEAIRAFVEAAAETGDIVYQVDCERIAARARERWGLGDEMNSRQKARSAKGRKRTVASSLLGILGRAKGR